MKRFWFIIGTGSGIGKALAETLLEQGCTVHGFSRHNEIQHPQFTFHHLDLTEIHAVDECIFPDCPDAEELGFIYNAGTLGDVQYMGELEAQLIRETYRVNVTSAHILFNNWIHQCRSAPGKKMMAAISTGAATFPYDGWSLYNSTKAALQMLCQTTAKEQEISGSGISVFAIAPGVVDTHMQTSIRNVSEAQFSNRKKFIRLHEENALKDAHVVSEKIIALMRAKQGSGEVIHKIT